MDRHMVISCLLLSCMSSGNTQSLRLDDEEVAMARRMIDPVWLFTESRLCLGDQDDL